MAREREPSTEVVVFRVNEDGPVAVLRSLEEAATYFGLHRDTILRRIITGQKVKGEFFVDWSLDADMAAAAKLEIQYLSRTSHNKEYSKRWRDNHAAQEDL